MILQVVEGPINVSTLLVSSFLIENQGRSDNVCFTAKQVNRFQMKYFLIQMISTSCKIVIACDNLDLLQLGGFTQI